ncbi:MAG: hypothetical protein ACRD0E_01345 [Acidimicrobiales bacterium]
MINASTLARLEGIIDDSGVPGPLEGRLPIGVRPRQLRVRTLVLGILATLADGRPAHLSRVHQALISLPEADQWRLGVIVNGKTRPHQLTYRQVEYTFSRLTAALAKSSPDGAPSDLLSALADSLVEASIPSRWKDESRSLAVDWSDIETFATRRTNHDGLYNDPEASWGHRKGGGPGEKDELFFGYYFSLATMVADDSKAAVPELVRRMTLTSCHLDPARAMVSVLERLVASGVTLGDLCVDSGYAHRIAAHWALPVRALGATLVMDLHPHDRGTQGTFGGAICWNGNLYCPSTPKALFELEPLSRQAGKAEVADHDARTCELACYKLGPITADDQDGYHRVSCPAVLAKVRCPWRSDSMTLTFTHPEILSPPEHPQSCCLQQTITVPPSVNAKTRQKHDYPSLAHRRSYARRTAAERSNARVKDPATTDVARGWCRVMGLPPMSLLFACALVVRNLAMVDAFDARQADNIRRQVVGLAPKTRRRRRNTINDLVGAATAHPPP